MRVALDHAHAGRSSIILEPRRVRAIEHAFHHPLRGSIVSVTSHSLQELDATNGALMGEITFDLLPITPPSTFSVAPSSTGVGLGLGMSMSMSMSMSIASSQPSAANSSNSQGAIPVLEHVVPIGPHYVLGVYQSRGLVVWDLQDMVLHSVSELEKQQKGIAAITASLCGSQWIFYATEGSNSIKVAKLETREPPKKIARRNVSRNSGSQISSLAYHTSQRLVAAGTMDGSLLLWRFAEENANASAGREEAAVVTALLSVQTAAITPVISLSFAGHRRGDGWLVAGYQHRVVEIWRIGPNPISTDTVARAAILHAACPDVPSFARKSGVLSCLLHPQLSLLAMHWHCYVTGSSSVAITEIGPTFNPAKQNASPNTAVPVTEWCSAFFPRTTNPTVQPSNAALLLWSTTSGRSPLSVYLSSPLVRRVTPLTMTPSTMTPMLSPSLSVTLQVSLEQYATWQGIPTTLWQLNKCGGRFKLQRFSLTTGTSETVATLPTWSQPSGSRAVLLPCQILANATQSVVCVKLQAPNAHSDDHNTYVLIQAGAQDSSQVNALAQRSNDEDNGDDDDNDHDHGSGSGATSGVTGAAGAGVTYGSPMEALDVCFCLPLCSRPDSQQASQSSYVFVVLATTGRLLSFQSSDSQLTSTVTLRQPVTRMFATPFVLPSQSPIAQVCHHRLLYVCNEATSLLLSEDDLSIPVTAKNCSSNAVPGAWSTSHPSETIVDVLWNSSTTESPPTNPSGNDNSSSSPAHPPPLVAVRTTTRVVILSSEELCEIASYTLDDDSENPSSLLWMAQTLLFVTATHQIRYMTPTSSSSNAASSILLASLAAPLPATTTERVVLLAAAPDRLAYALVDPDTRTIQSHLRPLAIVEPLVLGSHAPSACLRAIVERDVLLFVTRMGAPGERVPCPLTDRVLTRLSQWPGSWRELASRALVLLLHPSRAVTGTTTSSTTTSSTSSSSSTGYRASSSLSASVLTSLLLQEHEWRDAIRVLLVARDPALEEYVLGEDAPTAKLPSRTSALADRFQEFGHVLATLGQWSLAVKCFDAAGADTEMLEILQVLHGKSIDGDDEATPLTILKDLQKTWVGLNPPLAALTNAMMMMTPMTSPRDAFAGLCCQQITQTERRGRLLKSIHPLDAFTMALEPPGSKPNHAEAKESNNTTAMCPRASVSPWLQLSPEDARDAIGVSTTPHFAEDLPAALPVAAYALLSRMGIDEGGGGGGNVLQGAMSNPEENAAAAGTSSSPGMTIGPFLGEEDAVVAYWRFEEGATAASARESEDGSESSEKMPTSLDTSKRENHLVLHGPLAFAALTAPIDQGEPGVVQEAFALRFPLAHAVEGHTNHWGATCAVPVGQTLDVGIGFDDDPYRRKLTAETWVRNYALATTEQDSEGSSAFNTGSGRYPLLARRSDDGNTTYWELSLVTTAAVDAQSSTHPPRFLELAFGSYVLRADHELETDASAWLHVAFTVDITSPRHVTLELFVQARSVGKKALTDGAILRGTKVDRDSTTLHVGPRLVDHEVAEVRVWATTRLASQLYDGKDTYLGLAETKRRLRIAIHRRDCACAKCMTRRQQGPTTSSSSSMPTTPLGSKSLLAAPLITTPPAASARRRRKL